MSLPRWLQRVADREPDFVIGRPGDPYLERWWVIPRNKIFNIYLHHFHRSDDDRALHDHPWFNLSILLDGEYIEETILSGGSHRRITRRAGAWKFRSPWAAHRVELTGSKPWTLFITGPVMRTWGFHCSWGWRPWKEFVEQRDGGNSIGRGCD